MKYRPMKQDEKKKSWELANLQFFYGAVMNVARSVIVEFVGDKIALGLVLVDAILTPIKDCAWTRFIHGDPWHYHPLPHMISLCYMNLVT